MILLKRFLMMIRSLKKSDKPVSSVLLDVSLENCQSTTGRNLRNILVESKRRVIEDLDRSVIEELSYFHQPEEDGWVIEAVVELLEHIMYSMI